LQGREHILAGSRSLLLTNLMMVVMMGAYMLCYIAFGADASLVE